MKLKLSLSIIFLVSICILNASASVKTIPAYHFNKPDNSTKLTINLGNIDLLSNIQIKEIIQKHAKNFLANPYNANCSIIIKASVFAKKSKEIEHTNVAFEVKINGTISEIKKEIETVDVVILDLKKSYKEATF